MKNEINILDADISNMALAKKKRKQIKIVDCKYCESTGRDIFNKVKVCPFCGGSLKALMQKSKESQKMEMVII